jgi:hypothetical protein
VSQGVVLSGWLMHNMTICLRVVVASTGNRNNMTVESKVTIQNDALCLELPMDFQGVIQHDD